MIKSLRRVGCALCLMPALVWSSPRIEHWETTQGIPVLFVAAPEIPMLTLRVVFAAGSAYDGATPGLASLTSGLLGEGTQALSTDEFHRQMEATGAQLSAGATRDMAWVSLRSLTDPNNAEPALMLATAALSRPRFAKEDFARMRQQMLAGLQQEKGSPGSIADKAMRHAIYGDHPYARPSEGTEASVAAFALATVGAFYKRYYVADNALVVMVGAVTREAAARIAETLVADLPRGARAPAVPGVSPPIPGQSLRIDFPGEQSHILFAQPGISRHDPDYFPLVVGNHVLGGNGPVSLLFNEIREQRGLSYSVDSSFEPMAAAGPFVIRLQTDHRREQEAQKVLQATLGAFLAAGPSEAALLAAKHNLIGGFPLRIDSNSKLMEYLTVIGFYDLPLEYLDTYPRAVEAVTAAQIREAFQRRVRIANMAQITVGPRATNP